MRISCGVQQKFANIEARTSWLSVHIDSEFIPNHHSAEVYRECLENSERYPLIGLLAKRQYIDKMPKKHPRESQRNQQLIEKDPKIAVLIKNFKEKLKTLYPRTMHIREYIINTDRVVLNTVEPKRNYGMIEKLILALRRFV